MSFKTAKYDANTEQVSEDHIFYLDIKTARDQKRAKYLAGPMVAHLPWAAGQTIVSGDIRRLSTGKTIVGKTGGITGTVEPPVNGMSSLTADISSTTVLTVSAIIGGAIGIGTEIQTGGATAGTRIIAQVSGTPGGAGVYTLSGNAVATVASTRMAAISNPLGRDIADNTVVWNEHYFPAKVVSDSDAPVVTVELGANAAEIRTATNSVYNSCAVIGTYALGTAGRLVTPKCGILTVQPFVVHALDYRYRDTAGGPYDSVGVAYGYPVGMMRSTGLELESIITDMSFCVEINDSSSSPNYGVDVDDRIVEGSYTQIAGGSPRVLKYDFEGNYAKRKVTFRSHTQAQPRLSGIYTTQIGKIQAGNKSTDTLLCLGDSMWDSYDSAPGNGQITTPLGILLKKGLGFDGVVVANASASGYAVPSILFSVPQMIADPTNRALFRSYGINHVMVGAGINDNSIDPVTLRAAVASTLRAIRELFGSAVKITVFSPWYIPLAGTFAAQVAGAVRLGFSDFGDSNSRYLSFIGDTDLAADAFISGNGSPVSAALNATTGSRALLVGGSGGTTHFSYSGVKPVADFIVNEVNRLWNNEY